MLCWLVVDDSDVIRKVARRVLEDMNYLVLEAESGQAALEQCARAMPEIILLDWHMPGMSGHDFLAALRGAPLGAASGHHLLHNGKRSPGPQPCLRRRCANLPDQAVQSDDLESQDRGSGASGGLSYCREASATPTRIRPRPATWYKPIPSPRRSVDSNAP